MALDKAERALASAQAALEQATMRAPMAGVVSQLPFAVGDSVTTSDEVIVIGEGSIKVTIDVSETSYLQVAAGQKATLTQAGLPTVEGHVASKNLVPNDDGSTFPVTIIATGEAAQAFASGATVTTSITIGSDSDAVVVPVSAVTRDGTSATAKVLSDGAVKTVSLTLGSVGDTLVAVTKGISVGDRIVIADATTALPTAGTTTRRTTTGGLVSGATGGGGQPPR